MKERKWIWTAAFALLLMVLFGVTRYAMPGLYVPEWAARNVFWPLAAVIFLPVLCGKVLFSLCALVGYVAGLGAGELLGGWESHIGPQYLHHGWWIFLLVFALSCAVGVVIQRGKKKK